MGIDADDNSKTNISQNTNKKKWNDECRPSWSSSQNVYAHFVPRMDLLLDIASIPVRRSVELASHGVDGLGTRLVG